MKTYTFTSKNKGDIEVSITGEYRDGCKDLEVYADGMTKEFEEIDGGSADDIIDWLLEIGVEFESDRAMYFNKSYIASVMCDEDTTEQELLNESGTWTDDKIATWKKYL